MNIIQQALSERGIPCCIELYSYINQEDKELYLQINKYLSYTTKFANLASVGLRWNIAIAGATKF